MHNRIRGGWGLFALMMVCASTRPAFAQTDEQRAAARSLATDGATAFKESRFKDAVDLFSKAESLVHAPPHLLYLARSYAKLGQYVRAREAYLKISREELSAGVPQAFRDAKTAAAHEIGGIEPKIGGLVIKIEGAEGAKDLQVKVDGSVVPAVLLGASQPIDPGEHRVEAMATGFRAQPRSLVVGDGERASVGLKLEADASATPVAAATAGVSTVSASGEAPANPGSGAPPPADTGTSGGSNGTRIGAYAALGMGAIGLGLGTVFMLKSGSKRSDADALCCAYENKDQVNQLDSDADSARTVGIVGLAIGGASAATGVALLLLSGNGSDSKSATSLHPFIGVNAAGIAGRF